jgi:hypothetical protein
MQCTCPARILLTPAFNSTIDAENSQCYGIVYDASQGTSDSTFIVGAAFLQHIYSAYRFSDVSSRRLTAALPAPS